MSQRRELIDSEHPLSVREQCSQLSIHRSGLYYAPRGEKPENLKILRIMDEHYLKHPTAGGKNGPLAHLWLILIDHANVLVF